MGLGGSACLQADRQRTPTIQANRSTWLRPIIPSSFPLSSPTGLVGHTVRRVRTKCEELLRSCLPRRLTLNDRRLIRLLAGHVGHHQLPQLHELLNLLFVDLAEHLKRLHPPVRCLSHTPKRIEDRLLTLKLLPLE